MKRLGFVSNSSSTSFTIKLEKSIQEYSFKELCELFRYNNPMEQIFKKLKESQDLGDYTYEIECGWDSHSSEAEMFLLEDNEYLNRLIINSKSNY